MNSKFVWVVALLCAMVVVSPTFATTLNVDLRLDFNGPTTASGGQWTVSALAGDFGLAGVAFDVDPANFAGDFLISNTIFEVQESAPSGSGMGFMFALGDDIATPTLNVGVGSPVDLVTGSFDPGDVPALANLGANLFNASGAAVEVSGANLTSTLTQTFVPEPTSVALVSLALLSLGTLRRR